MICAVVLALLLAIEQFDAVALAKAEPIQIAEVKHDGPVDFEKEVLPLLRRNCIACHNATKKENSLILENPKAIIEGGDSGPAAEPGMGSESMLLQLAAHQSDPAMPPKD